MSDLLSGLGLRDVLLVAVALAVVYFIVMWLRFLQLRRKARPASEPKAPPMEPIVRRETPRERVYVEPLAVPVPPKDVSHALPRFDEALNQAALESRVSSLTQEVQALRGEMAELQAGLIRLEASRNISPLYGEAVSLAHHGMDAATIAVRCGISIAEAELVTSLSGQARAAATGGHFPEEEFS